MFEFLLPDIGEGISEAELISWSVQPGDRIEEDQELATISTDKVNVELPSPRAGTVKELCWEPGDIVKVGAVFVRIETSADADANAEKPEQSDAPAHKPAPPSRRVAGPNDRSAVTGDHSLVVAPSTRRLAQQLGIDLSQVIGSGQDGRILRSDLESMAAANRASKSDSASSVTPNSIRSAMAERMAYSAHTLAHSTMSFEVPADGLLIMREQTSSAAQAGDVKISMSVILAKCVAAALTRHARFNATIDEEAGGLLLHDEVNLGLALASAHGLSVPVLRSVQNKGLLELAREVSDIVDRGHKGQLQVNDYRGGTFTLSNTGNMEQAAILSARPVINAPQTAILWVSKIKTRPRVIDERLEAGPMLNCSLSFDHRFIDGADSVAFINDLSLVFQEPNQA